MYFKKLKTTLGSCHGFLTRRTCVSLTHHQQNKCPTNNEPAKHKNQV